MEITTTVSVPIVISIPDPAVDNPGIPSATQVIRAKCPKKHGQRPNPASDRIRVRKEARDAVNHLLGDLGDTYMDVATNLILLGVQALREQADGKEAVPLD